ncbi:MAG: hypothetical protein RL026_2516 [Pseudomonadota bacterium]|jgi:outer membrane receptor protein involved in Fe transport
MSARIRAAVGSIVLASAIGAAQAQVLEEVVVTAQKRTENVREVPIAISAYTAEALQERAVGDVSQLANSSSNVSFDAGTPFSGSTSVLSAFIRGIGQNDFAFNLDPGVGIYLDGVYLARTVGANQDLLDVERIEVLKGPQGTLFGRNTIGGAVSIVTRDPGNEQKIIANLTTGSYERVQAGVSADIPFSDALKSSFTVSMKRREGYMKRVPFPYPSSTAQAFEFNSPQDFKAAGYDEGGDSEGGDNAWSARAKFKYDTGGSTRATFAVDFTQNDQSQLANSVIKTTIVPGPFADLAANNIPGTALNPGANPGGFLFAGLYNFCIGSTAAQIAARNATNLCGPRGTPLNPTLLIGGLVNPVTGDGVNVDTDRFNNRMVYNDQFLTGNKDTTYATGNNYTKLRNHGLSLTLEHDLTDNMMLRSITSYRDLFWSSGMDLDGSPIMMLATSFNMNQIQFSEELQLNGTANDGAVKYVIGGYYFREGGNLHDFVTFAEGLLQVDGPNNLQTSNYAAFAQVDWRVSDLVGLTFGGRYTKEDKDFEGFQSDLNGFNYKLFNAGDPLAVATYTNARAGLGFPDPSSALRYYTPGTQNKKFNNFSPKLGVQLYPVDDTMVYASYSQGYKTGGWTTRLSNPVGNVAPGFGEEEATTYELGLKSLVLDRRLNISAAVFQTDYEGIQLNFQEGVSPTIKNAGDARIRGAELELNAAVTEAFTVSASVGLADAEYTAISAQAAVAPNPFQEGTFVGAKLPKTPNSKINVSPRYEIGLDGGASVVLVADYTRTSSMRNDTEGTFLLNRPTTDVLNAGLTYKAASGTWEATLGGTNLTDERFLTTGQAQIAGGQIYGTWNRPAEWYLSIKVNQ